MPRSVLLAAFAALILAAPASADLQPGPFGADPATGHGVLRFPQAVASSPGGAFVWVADQYSSVVQEFTRDGTWVKDLGWRADDGQPGRFGVIGGLALDRANHLYVLDSENDRVQVFRSDTGAWLGEWGTPGSGPGQFHLGANTGAGGIAVSQPTTADKPLVYIADQDNHRIQRFTLDKAAGGDANVLPSGAPDEVWGHHGDCATSCDDFAMNFPQGVAVDPVDHRVFVADDDNHRVLVYDPTGGYLAQFGTFGTGDGQFRFPYDVGVDARSPRLLYVADNNNHRVQAFDAQTFAFQESWGGFGSGPGQLEYPRALAALADDPQGGVFVADTANDRVQGFDAGGHQTAAWGIAGRGPGYVTRPGGAAVGDDGRVYVADTLDNRIEILNPDGSYAGQWGYIASSSGFAAPAAGAGQFDTPRGVAYDPSTGHVWVADTGNDRVQELDASGSAVNVYGGPGPGQFSAPRGIAVDPAGDVYVADTGHDQVQRRDAATGAWSVVDAGTPLHAPAAVAVAADGSLLVGDSGRVVRVGSGALPGPPGGLTAPAGLATVGAAVYVTDGDRVLRTDLAGSSWTTVAGAGNGTGAVVQPAGLAVTPSLDTLYLADAGNDRVQRFTDPAGPPARTLHVAIAGAGSVHSDPAGLDCASTCDASFPAGTAVTLTATPAAGAVFSGWGAPCAGTGPCTVRVRDAGAAASAAFGTAPAPPAAAAPSVVRPPVDRTKPRVTRLRVSPSAFRVPRSPSGRRRGGAKLLLTLSERATLRVSVSHAGRVLGLLWKAAPVGSGRVTLRLTGLVKGHRLRPGRYRLAVVATDLAGNRARAVYVSFTIRR